MIKEIPNLYNEYPFLKEVDSCSLSGGVKFHEAVKTSREVVYLRKTKKLIETYL